MAKNKLKFPTKTIVTTILSGQQEPTINALSRVYGCSWVTMKRWILDHPEIEEALDQAQEELVEKAENVVSKAIDEGDVSTAKWLLSLRHKKYKEQTDVDISDGSIKITINRKKD